MIKSRYFKVGICVVIFFSLIGISNLLLGPIYNQIGKSLDATLARASGKIEKEIGLSISYESLSPSILGVVNINDILIVDVQSQKTVCVVHRLSLSYSILDLIKGGGVSAMKRLSLRGVELEIIEDENNFWIKKIAEYRKTGRSAEDVVEIQEDGSDVLRRFIQNLDLEKLDFYFLKNVRVYQLRALYKMNAAALECNISKAVFSGNNEGMIDAKVDGDLSADIAGRKITSSMDFSATLPKGIDGSSAVLRFTNLAALGCRVRYMGFLAEYKDMNFRLSMLPSASNVFMQFNAALESGDLSAMIVADNFNVATLVQIPQRTQYSKSLSAMNFSVTASAEYNVESKVLAYKSNGDVFVPAAAFPSADYADDVLVSYAVSGDEKSVAVEYLNTSGERYNMNCEGKFDFETFQPEGIIYVDSLVLPNGGEFSTEVYIEPQTQGFMCFSPQLKFNQRNLTAAELRVIPSEDSWDLTFDVSDFSNIDSEEPGRISLYGSYEPSSKEYQASASVSSLHIDTVVMLAAFFANANMRPLLERASDATKPFVFACDAFASGVGGSFAFNLPFAFVANTTRDDQMLILAVDGNNESVRVSNLDFAFAGQRLVLNADSQILGKEEGLAVNGRLELNNMPYNFTGLFHENMFSINSDYGFQLAVNTDTSSDEAFLTGIFSMMEFPVVVNEHTYSLSNETSFSYAVSTGFNVSITHFEGRVIDSGTLGSSIAFSANLDSYGMNFSNIAYSDNVSSLSGKGSVFWNVMENEFESANFNFALANPDGIERISLAGDVSNPMRIKIGFGDLLSGALLKNLFMTATLDIDSLRSQRFVSTSREGDSITASVGIQGNMSNPFVTLSVPSAVFTLQNTPLILSAQACLEDMVFEAHDVSVDFGDTQVKRMGASLDLKKWIGTMQFDLETVLFEKKRSTEFYASVEALSAPTGGIPESLTFSLDTAEIVEGKGKKKKAPYHIGVVKMQDDFIITSSENIGINGSVSNYRNVDITINNPLPFMAKIQGVVGRDDINLIVFDVRSDAKKLSEAFELEVVKLYKGAISGGFALTGSLEKPFFDGALEIDKLEFNVPDVFRKKASTDKATLVMSGSQFYTVPTRCSLGRAPVDVTVVIQLNRLAFEGVDVHVKTVDDAFAPLNINFTEIHVKGDGKVDLNIAYDYEMDTLSVSGDVVVKDTNAEFGATRINEILSGFVPKKQTEEDDSVTVDVSLNIKTQSRVQISYATFLRGVVVPGSELEVTYFGDQDRLLLDGDVPIRSGEIIYLNSSFYIKNGSIHFSDNDESFDPRVSVNAESRTHDSNNDAVTISLSVNNQHLSELSPRLTASPAKSEREIMEILGTIITADSENAASFAGASGDYAIQTVFTRNLENALRDFFKFDIFSLRTTVVQNAIRQGMGSKNISNTAGNYLDGTTVYIGKYLSDSIFADAMLRLDYDENRVGNKYTVNGISFRPEIGFVVESPFANIRWSLSPDFEDLVNMRLVQNTALTLSWKFNF